MLVYSICMYIYIFNHTINNSNSLLHGLVSLLLFLCKKQYNYVKIGKQKGLEINFLSNIVIIYTQTNLHKYLYITGSICHMFSGQYTFTGRSRGTTALLIITQLWYLGNEVFFVRPGERSILTLMVDLPHVLYKLKYNKRTIIKKYLQQTNNI